jgi:low temperature requirement protein LtrA
VSEAGYGPVFEPEQRVSWLELFFDLVVVVAIAVLADRLHEDAGVVDALLVLMLYLAVWLVWVSFMLYGNVAGDRTHQRAMILAMGCIGVMAASVPSIRGGTEAAADSSRAFAVAYVVARVLSMQVWRSTAKAMVDWPIAQTSIGLSPWLVSLFVHEDWRYYLWALGLVLDVGLAVLSNDRAWILRMLRRESDEHRSRRKRPESAVTITEATVNVPHLDERLGVYMIIVLGEAVTQVVLAASQHPWGLVQPRGAAAAFLLLVGLWWLTFQYGFAASPESALARMPPRFGLPLHYLTSAGIVFIAGGLGSTVTDPTDVLDVGPRWLACGGLAGYFLATAVAAVLVGASMRWLLGWALPSILLPLLLGAFGDRIQGWGVAALLLLAVLWQISYGWIHEGRRRRQTAVPAIDG